MHAQKRHSVTGHTGPKSNEPDIVFVTGCGPLRGLNNSMSTEFRDYAIGLQISGAPVSVIDLLSDEALKSSMGALALSRMGKRASKPGVYDAIAIFALRVGEHASKFLNWIRTSRFNLGDRFSTFRAGLARSWDQIHTYAERTENRRELGIEDSVTLDAVFNRKPDADRKRIYFVNAYDLELFPLRPWMAAAAPKRRATDKWVLRSVTEYTGVPAPTLASIPFFSEIWVPSEFQLKCFIQGGVPKEKVHKVPESIDTELFSPAACQPLSIPNQRKFTFLSLSHHSLYPPDVRPFWNQARKAIPSLLEAFAKAFEPDDDVCLVIKGNADVESQTELVAKWMRHLGREDMCPQILHYRGPLPSRDLPRLYAGANAYVGVSRGEGWGRPLSEAMAMELPTIATRFGGNTEFMSEENAYLVNYSLRPVRDFNPWRDELGFWAEPSVDHLADVLRRIFENQEEARLRGLRGAETIRTKFNRTTVAAQMRDRCRALFGAT